jgi:hypothetical protein
MKKWEFRTVTLQEESYTLRFSEVSSLEDEGWEIVREPYKEYGIWRVVVMRSK